MMRQQTKSLRSTRRARTAAPLSGSSGSFLSRLPRGAFRALLAVAVVAVYAQTLRFGLLDWDDDINITQNPYLQPPGVLKLLHLWTHPYSGLYIPLVYTSYALDLLIGGGQAWAFHLVNVALHALSAVMVFEILCAFGWEAKVSFLGAAVFVLHPLQAEPVAWVTGRKDLLSGAASLGSILAYVLWRQRGAAWRYALALLLFMTALLSKPASITVPLVLLIIEWFVLGTALRQSMTALAAWFVLAAGWAAFTAQTQPIPAILASRYPVWSIRPIVAADALVFYIAKLFWPVHLAPVYGRVPAVALKSATGYVALLPLLAGLGYLLWKRTRSAAALLIIPAFLLPVLGLVPFLFQVYSTVADRYFYLPMFGAAMMAAMVADWSMKRFPLSPAIGGAILLVLGGLSFRQASCWSSSAVLWKHSVAVAPDAAVAHTSLGLVYAHTGQTDEAAEEYQAAIALDKDSAEAHNGLGLLLARSGRMQEAAREFRAAVEAKPDVAAPYVNLAKALAALGRKDESLEVCREGLKRNPGDRDLLHQETAVRSH